MDAKFRGGDSVVVIVFETQQCLACHRSHDFMPKKWQIRKGDDFRVMNTRTIGTEFLYTVVSGTCHWQFYERDLFKKTEDALAACEKRNSSV